MWPDRVGGIAATCAEAFRPYSPVLANLTGTCYWWGWVPTCGLTAILSASALHQWYLPWMPVKLLAVAHRRHLHGAEPGRDRAGDPGGGGHRLRSAALAFLPRDGAGR